MYKDTRTSLWNHHTEAIFIDQCFLGTCLGSFEEYHVPFYKNWEHEKDWGRKRPYANFCQTNVEFLKYRLTAVIDFFPHLSNTEGDTILGMDINHIQEANTSSCSLSVKDISSFRLRWKSTMQEHCQFSLWMWDWICY